MSGIQTKGTNSLLVLLPSSTLTVMAAAMIAPVLNLIREDLHLDYGSAGIIITIHGLIIALASPVIGKIIDRYGVKKPFVAGLFVYGLSGGSGLFINHYWPLLLSRAILGIAIAAIYTCITVMILNLYTDKTRDKIMGWRSSCNNLGGVIWGIVGGCLGMLSWHMPFAVYLVGIPLCIAAVLILPEIKNVQLDKSSSPQSTISLLKRNSILYLLYLLMFFALILLYVIVTFIPPRLEEVGISSPLWISLFISALSLTGAITSFLYWKVRSHLSFRELIIIVFILWTISMITISQSQAGYLIVIALLIFGISQGLVVPTISLWLGEVVPLNFRGRMISYLGTCMYMGQFIAPILFSPLIPALGIEGVFLIAGIISFIFMLVFFLLYRYGKLQEQRVEIQRRI